MKLLLKISIILFFCIFALGKTHAQIPSSLDGVTISVTDSNPKPGQSVDVKIESFNFDLNAASIVWIVNGKVHDQGIGVTRTTLTVPAVGYSLNIVASIKGSDGRELKKTITLKSSSVDMIWETGGYSAPFFQGKVPFSYQNKVKIVAVPHIAKDKSSEQDPKTLVYAWRLGGKYIDGGQGYGKQSVIIDTKDLNRGLEITVDVTTRDQTGQAVGSMTLEPSKPSVSFYEEDSLYGILFNKSILERTSLVNSEMKVIAIPFGFNIDDKGINYSWNVNGITQPDLLKNRSITIRTKGDSSGSSNVRLEMNNESSIVQSAVNGFTVYFNKK